MKIFVIKSDHDSTPLAEIRTDGNAIEFIVDNTDGALPQQAGASFKRLNQIVSSSSHLSMEEPTEPTANLLRYELSNGDIIEITTDIKTCLLNGRLLSQAEKKALLSAIQMREISVVKRADPTAPIPVIPSPPRDETSKEPPSVLNGEVIKMLEKSRRSKSQDREKTDSISDPEIEGAQMSGMDPLQELHAKNMLYYFRHGAFKGEPSNAE